MIQSNKEDLSQNISHIKKQAQQEKNKKIETIANSYINYIQELNLKTKSSNKNFYILIQFQNNSKKENVEEHVPRWFLKEEGPKARNV